MKKKQQHTLHYKNINITIKRWKQKQTKTISKINKIVASYDSLHYCQCDIGRKQKTNKKQNNLFHANSWHNMVDRGRKLQRLLGRRRTVIGTRVQQEVCKRRGKVRCVRGEEHGGGLGLELRGGVGNGGVRGNAYTCTQLCASWRTCTKLAISDKKWGGGLVSALWPLRLWAVPFGSWKDSQLVSWCYVVAFYGLRSVGLAGAKLGPVVFADTLKGWTHKQRGLHTHTYML